MQQNHLKSEILPEQLFKAFIEMRYLQYIYFKSGLSTYIHIPCSIPLTRCPDEAKVEPLLDFP